MIMIMIMNESYERELLLCERLVEPSLGRVGGDQQTTTSPRARILLRLQGSFNLSQVERSIHELDFSLVKWAPDAEVEACV